LKSITHNSNNPFNSILTTTRNNFFDRVKSIFSKATNHKEQLDLIEEILITSDIGFTITELVLDHLKSKLKTSQNVDLFNESKSILYNLLSSDREVDTKDLFSEISTTKPYVILVSGVNGVGKTTTVAKLANMLSESNHKVIIGACDSFRAGAIEQIESWGLKLNIKVISNKLTNDPASVAFDTLTSAKANNYDVVILDTAGRLQTNTNLMGELAKITNITKRFHPDAPHLSLLVLDATVGQNGVEQAKVFTDSANCNAVILTKLDTSAKGGIILRIYQELNLPILFVGTGEQIDDIENFDKEQFLDGFFSYEFLNV
jgi:fused signal recognition particle receptor